MSEQPFCKCGALARYVVITEKREIPLCWDCFTKTRLKVVVKARQPMDFRTIMRDVVVLARAGENGE